MKPYKIWFVPIFLCAAAVSPAQALTVSCTPAPKTALIYQPVVWTATVSGDSGNVSIAWSGSNGLSGTGAKTEARYLSRGQKTASIKVSSGGASASASCSASVTVKFTLFDRRSIEARASGTPAGMSPVYLTSGRVFARGDREVADEASTRKLADEVANLHQILILDIENWKVDGRRWSDDEVSTSIQKFLQVIRWIKSERPGIKVGLYGVLPVRDYNGAARYGRTLSSGGREFDQEADQSFQDRKQASDRLKELAAAVDVICPSLYINSPDQESWTYFAKQTLAEASVYGKPVIPFMRPMYHPHAKGGVAGMTMSNNDWNQQLETVYKSGHADGVVLHLPSRDPWDPQASWWKVTQQFLARH